MRNITASSTVQPGSIPRPDYSSYLVWYSHCPRLRESRRHYRGTSLPKNICISFWSISYHLSTDLWEFVPRGLAGQFRGMGAGPVTCETNCSCHLAILVNQLPTLEEGLRVQSILPTPVCTSGGTLLVYAITKISSLHRSYLPASYFCFVLTS